jgi:hypothetical protein
MVTAPLVAVIKNGLRAYCVRHIAGGGAGRGFRISLLESRLAAGPTKECRDESRHSTLKRMLKKGRISFVQNTD